MRHEIVLTSSPPTNGPRIVVAAEAPGPHAERAAAFLALEARRDDRERSGHDERAGGPLQHAGDDEDLDRRARYRRAAR